MPRFHQLAFRTTACEERQFKGNSERLNSPIRIFSPDSHNAEQNSAEVVQVRLQTRIRSYRLTVWLNMTNEM